MRVLPLPAPDRAAVEVATNPPATPAGGFLVLQATGSYLTIFALASCCYLVGLSIIHLKSPRLETVNLEVYTT